MEPDKSRLSVKRKLDTTADVLSPPPAQPPVKKKDGRGRPRKYPLPDQAKAAPVTLPQPVCICLARI